MIDLFIDIETIPTQLEWVKSDIRDKVKPPAQYKKQESIDKWMEENLESVAESDWLKTSFDGSLGEIVSICWSLGGGEIKSADRSNGKTELDLLNEFFSVIEFDAGVAGRGITYTPRIRWIGHNIIDFDLRFLWQRCVINNANTRGISIPVDRRYNCDHVYCTLKAWKGNQAKAGGSMDRLCRLFGIEGKGDFDGSMVWPAYQTGEMEKITEYCKDDVSRTIQIFKRMQLEEK